MTTKPETWPARVYLQTRDEYSVYIHEESRSQSVEYFRADLVAAREQEIIRATLKAVIEHFGLTYNEKLELRRIDPATILNNMEVEK